VAYLVVCRHVNCATVVGRRHTIVGGTRRHRRQYTAAVATEADRGGGQNLPHHLNDLPKAQFAFPGPLRDRLVAAILTGAKTSTSGLLREYEHEDEPLPVAGDRSVLVDSADRPCAVLETTEVRVVPLAEVDLAHAVDEGEGFTDVAGWRRAHIDFWQSAPMRAALGDETFTVDDRTMVVAERFRVVQRIWRSGEVALAYAAESRAAVDALRAVPEADFDRPTRCAPWTVKELLAHTVIALSRTVEMLDDSAPAAGPAGPVDAVGYYAPDARFRPDADGGRIADAQRWAAARTVVAAVDELAARAATAAARVAVQPPDRLVVTRHGDLMTLTDFQATRVVELAVHGVDLADGLGMASWLTAPAADLVVALSAGTTLAPLRAARRWDRPTLVRAVTGRVDSGDVDPAELHPQGVRSPFFGGTHRPTVVGEE